LFCGCGTLESGEIPVREAYTDACSETINVNDFYSQYHGHPIQSLATLHQSLRKQGKRIIWLLGDSSLDNKYWVHFDTATPCNGYERVMTPMVIADVCYWLNESLSRNDSPYAAINCAVEASTLYPSQEGENIYIQFIVSISQKWTDPSWEGYDRRDALLGHDEFVRKNLEKDDIIIVSVGGNDIALNPSLRILFSLFVMIYLYPICLSPLKTLFHDDLKHYINRVCHSERPSQIILCSYYYPCVTGMGWADKMLNMAGYDENPKKIQKLFDVIANILPKDYTRVNLSDVLCANDETDYVARVEPSVTGGKKIAQRFFQSAFGGI
jgi:hypothetical protein